MSKFLLCATFGLYLLQLCLAETQFNISCRYAGVFHVEKNRRYSLTRNESIELCRALNSTLPTMEQMTKAHKLGFETCRYGFIEDKIVIPRIKPYFLCAANYTGIYILNSNTSDRYDTYCYNASETRDQACEPIIRFDASWADNHTKIVIDNADGSRYMDGVRHTEPTPVTEDDRVGSGSIHDSDTTNPTIIRTRISGSPYYEVPSTDYSSGSGRKEYHPTRTNHIAPLDEDSTQISLMTERDNDHPNKRPHPTSTSFTSNKHDSRIRGQDGQTTTTNIFSQPRSAQIPEWLIIVASLVALTLVLAVCIAVNSRRRCGQKKKLVINNGKGSVSDKKMSGLNGEASKSQEMVHLVHKEQPDNRKGTCDEILTTDETQNQQEAGMKTGL
uniref:CD44 antigen n=1 Tax=Pelodiscus sinensis TaxID=13735 RepID=K7FSL3_PELSI